MSDDMLEGIIRLQDSLQKRVAVDPRIPPWAPRHVQYNVVEEGTLTGRKYDHLPGQERIKAWMKHVIAEAKETIGKLGYGAGQLKHWKNSIDWDAVVEEMIDIEHFLLAALMEVAEIVYGEITPEDKAKFIYEMYREKLEENHRRQDNGY